MTKGSIETKSRAARGNGTGASLGPNSEIGRKLKQYYDELITEEVPERFTSLLRQLEKKESGESDEKGSA